MSGRVCTAFVVLALLGLAAPSATAQAAADPVGPGSRVRVYLSPDALPPRGGVFTGQLVAVGDTLVVDTDGGSTIRVAPADLTGFDVSRGRPPYPRHVVVAGAALGLSAGVLFQPHSGSGTSRAVREAATPVVTAIAGALLGAQIARLRSAERWEGAPVLGVSPSGLALVAPLGRSPSSPSVPPPVPTR